MTDPISIIAVGASVLLTIGLASLALLHGWKAWLDYKRLELAAHGDIPLPAALAPATIAVSFSKDARFGNHLGGLVNRIEGVNAPPKP